MPMPKRSDSSSHGPQEAQPGGAGVNPSLLRTFGPMIAGLAIDGLDLMTYGPIGLYTGLMVGGIAGYLLAPLLGFSERGRWLCALMTGVYCTVPLTGFIPAAAIAAGLSQVFLRGQETRPASRAVVNAGNNSAISRAMIVITTKSSISVKPLLVRDVPMVRPSFTGLALSRPILCICSCTIITLNRTRCESNLLHWPARQNGRFLTLLVLLQGLLESKTYAPSAFLKTSQAAHLPINPSPQPSP